MKLPYFYLITDLKPGDHICCLYDNEEQLVILIIPFLRRSLEAKEKVIYIADSNFIQKLTEEFEKTHLNLKDYIQSEQLVFLTDQQIYLKDSQFHLDSMLEFWQQADQKSQSQGYQNLQVVSKMDWLLEHTELSDQMITYEAQLNQTIISKKITLCCQYSAQKFSATFLMELLNTHPLIMLGAEIIKNVYYIPPLEFFSSNRNAKVFRQRLQSLWEYQQVEKALRDSEERLNEAQNIAHIGSWDLDLHTRNLVLSPEIYHILEIPPNSLPSQYDIFKLIVHPEDQALVMLAYENSVRNKVPYEIVHRLMMQNGKIKFVHQRFKTFCNQAGQPIRCIGTVQDITERKYGEDRENKRRAILEMIARGAPLTQVLEQIVKVVETENPDCLCSILLLDRQGQHLLYGSAPSLPEEYNQSINNLLIGDGMGSCGTAAYTKRRVIVSNIDEHPYWEKYKPLTQKIGLRSCWSEPIFSSNGTVLGTFAIYHREPCIPNPEEISLIEAVVNFASLAIERKHAEEILRESEFSYRTLAQNLPGLVYRVLLQPPYSMLFLNEMLEPMTGFKQDELIRGNICSIEPLILPEDRPNVIQKVMSAIEQDSSFEVEYRLRCKDGSIRYFNERGRSIRDPDGRPAYIDGVIFDVSERHKSEEAMQQLYQQTQNDAKTKSELIQEINHRVKNNLIAIQGLLLAEREFTPKEGRAWIKTALASVGNRIQGMIDVHQMLSESQWKPMKLCELAHRVISSVLSSLSPQRWVTLKVASSPITVSPRQASNLALIFNELTTNTVKYGLGDRPQGKITVTIQAEPDYITIVYCDDGCGFPTEVLQTETPRYNVGLNLIKRLVCGTLRGKNIELTNQNGACVLMSIKTEETNRC